MLVLTAEALMHWKRYSILYSASKFLDKLFFPLAILKIMEIDRYLNSDLFLNAIFIVALKNSKSQGIQ